METPTLILGSKDCILVQGLESTRSDCCLVTLDEVARSVGVLGNVQMPQRSIGVVGGKDGVKVILARHKFAYRHTLGSRLLLHIKGFNSLDYLLLVLVKETHSGVLTSCYDVLVGLVDVNAVDSGSLTLMAWVLT